MDLCARRYLCIQTTLDENDIFNLKYPQEDVNSGVFKQKLLVN